MRIITFSILFILVSCASTEKKEQPAQSKDSDPITLATAKQMAKNSYVAGCIWGARIYRPRNRHMSVCLNQAKQFMKNNVDYILQQDGRRHPQR
jgi:hypothetical protein